jgi:hypothetical protein
MFYPKIHRQTILEIWQGDYITATANFFSIYPRRESYPGTLSGSTESSSVLSLNIATQIR